MTRDQQIADIKKACGAALGYEDPTFIQDENYSLADVLLAIDKEQPSLALLVSTTGRFYNIQKDVLATDPLGQWNLREDNLENQSDPCVAFIARLLANPAKS